MGMLRVKLTGTMAGPDGIRQPGDVVDVPEDEARRLIASSQAVEVPPDNPTQASNEPEDAPAKKTNPFTDEELAHGVMLDRWAIARCPDAFAIAKRGRGIIILGGDNRASERYWSAVRELREQLKSDLDAGLYELGIPPVTATATAQRIDADALDEVFNHIAWHYRSPGGYYAREHINLRLYRAGRFTSAGAELEVKAQPDIPTSKLGRTLPSTDKLYILVWDEVQKLDNPRKCFARHGSKVAFTRKLVGQTPFSKRPYTESAIARELNNVLRDLEKQKKNKSD